MLPNLWNRPYNVILKCLRGLEHNLFQELESFGIDRNNLVKFNRGVTVLECNLQQLYFLSYFPRLASKVYFEVGKFSLLDKERLFKGCENINWFDFINTGNSYLINCSVLNKNTHINSKKYACQLVKDGINRHFTSNLNIEPPTVAFKQPEIKLELEVDEECNATVLVDSVGSSLSNRGYRHKPNITDIDPTFACSILYDTGYSSVSDTPFSILEYEKMCNTNPNDPDSEDQTDVQDHDLYLKSKSNSKPKSQLMSKTKTKLSTGLGKPSIVDLFSGCGVFLIEAALLATSIPPGYFRDGFAFQKFPKFDELSFQMLKKYTDSKKTSPESQEWKELKGKFIGIERDWEKLESSVVSSETAGTLELMSFNQADYLKDGLNDAKRDFYKLENKDRRKEIKENHQSDTTSSEQKDNKVKSDNRKWEYMIAKLPQMKRLNRNLLENCRMVDDSYENRDGDKQKYKEKGRGNKSSKERLDKREREIDKSSKGDSKDRDKNKNKDGHNEHNLSVERYSTLLKSISRIQNKYFCKDSKGVLIVPSIIEKSQVEESFSKKLSVGRTFNKDGIDSTTYYTT